MTYKGMIYNCRTFVSFTNNVTNTQWRWQVMWHIKTSKSRTGLTTGQLDRQLPLGGHLTSASTACCHCTTCTSLRICTYNFYVVSKEFDFLHDRWCSTQETWVARCHCLVLIKTLNPGSTSWSGSLPNSNRLLLVIHSHTLPKFCQNSRTFSFIYKWTNTQKQGGICQGDGGTLSWSLNFQVWH